MTPSGAEGLMASSAVMRCNRAARGGDTGGPFSPAGNPPPPPTHDPHTCVYIVCDNSDLGVNCQSGDNYRGMLGERFEGFFQAYHYNMRPSWSASKQSAFD